MVALRAGCLDSLRDMDDVLSLMLTSERESGGV